MSVPMTVTLVVRGTNPRMYLCQILYGVQSEMVHTQLGPGVSTKANMPLFECAPLVLGHNDSGVGQTWRLHLCTYLRRR